MLKYILYITMRVVENYIYYFYDKTFNPETGDILSQLKTFKTLCAAFSVRVRKLVCEIARKLVRKIACKLVREKACELNGEYSLNSRGRL